MLLFIIIFFVMIAVGAAATILGFSFYLKRRSKSLAAVKRQQFDCAPPRSLFEPDAAELRAIERENEKSLLAKSAAQERHSKAEKAKAVRLFLEKWQTAPDKKTTAELLRVTASSESAEIFSEISENVVEIWRAGGIENLTAPDLADLLDSHFRLLPQQERTSGAIFWIKREIKKLRSRSEEIR
ncbi:MAG TPA: hypothetical protein VF692_06460 [Pyrinomonadaceae bacterium]|jgi:hypothetical protein